MTEFVRVCSTEDIPKGTAVSAEVGDVRVAVVHAECTESPAVAADGSGFFAVLDECSHATVALSEGEIDGCTLECWLHGSRFDLRTGQPTGPPATKPVPVYPVEIRDGDVYVGVQPSNGVMP